MSYAPLVACILLALLNRQTPVLAKGKTGVAGGGARPASTGAVSGPGAALTGTTPRYYTTSTGLTTPYVGISTVGGYYQGNYAYRYTPVYVGAGFVYYRTTSLNYTDGTSEQCNVTIDDPIPPPQPPSPPRPPYTPALGISPRPPPPPYPPKSPPPSPPAIPPPEPSASYVGLLAILTANTSYPSFDAVNNTIYSQTGYYFTDCYLQAYGQLDLAAAGCVQPLTALLLLLTLPVALWQAWQLQS